MKKPVWNSEYEALSKSEQKFAGTRKNSLKPSYLAQRLDQLVPAGLEAMLEAAFKKAFGLVFARGVGAIEATFSKEDRKNNYEIHRLTAKLRGDRKSLRAFGKEASGACRTNLLLSGAEGIGLGFFGIGLPDVPLYIALLLRAVYETALSFGFSYDTDEERYYILRIIEAALSETQPFEELDAAMNVLGERMRLGEPIVVDLEEQTERAARALAESLLCAKFLQGIPVIGVVGGFSNLTVMNRVSTYTQLKYKRRFLMAMKP